MGCGAVAQLTISNTNPTMSPPFTNVLFITSPRLCLGLKIGKTGQASSHRLAQTHPDREDRCFYMRTVSANESSSSLAMTDTSMIVYGTGCLFCGKCMAGVSASFVQAIAHINLTYQVSISSNNNYGGIDVKPRLPGFFARRKSPDG
jgi:hypothetical protein